jgi:hypothetical protein
MGEKVSGIYIKLWLEGSVADLDQNPHGSALIRIQFAPWIWIWLLNADPDLASECGSGSSYF